jgi:hypothetical protein
MKSDSDLKRAVEDELQWDPDIDATDIAVAVKDGIVTLTGFVRRYKHKRQAEAAAKRVAGVVGVANDIEVRLPIIHKRPIPELRAMPSRRSRNGYPNHRSISAWSSTTGGSYSKVRSSGTTSASEQKMRCSPGSAG